LKAIKAINDPEAFKLLGDETRRKIVFLLRVKEMTVSQIAAELNLTPQAVYHHIKKLRKVDMVEVTREERIDHLIESYYRATAETFFCSVGKTPRSREVAEDQVRDALNALKRLGFNLEFDENQISQLIDVWSELELKGHGSEFEDAISNLDNVDFFTKQTVQKYVETLSISDEEFVKQQELRKKFRDLLLSLVKK
jgi:DNA-binding transcriptional ArsR family regulator